MSNYSKPALHPETDKWYVAEFLDDYFGRREYGVRFPDDKVFPIERRFDPKTLSTDWFPKTDEVERTTIAEWALLDGIRVLDPDGFDRKDPYLMRRAYTREEWDKGVMNCTIERVKKHEDGKETVETKHADGTQDVEIKVTRLNIENRTPEDDIAEKAIIEAMSKKVVRVVVIHKPTNQSATFECKLPEVRKNAEEVVKKHMGWKEGDLWYVKVKDYVLVEFDADQIRVTSL